MATMKFPSLCYALVHPTTSHTILTSTSSRSVTCTSHLWRTSQARSLSLSQKRHAPQAATQASEASDASNKAKQSSDGKEDKPSRSDSKSNIREAFLADKLPSTRQQFEFQPGSKAPDQASLWAAPLHLRRRKPSAYDTDIANLMGSTTRAGNRNIKASNAGSGTASTASIFGAIRRQPLTPTARRQEDLANVIGDTLQGGIHARIDPPPPMRIDPFMGRAVVVNKTTRPLARALMYMSSTLKANNVRGDLIRQRFYERPGLKRKRLKRERWRKRFMGGFRDVVEKVRKMKAQGW